MQTTLEIRNKVVVNSPKSALKKKNKVEERGASSLGVKREHESTNLRAQKMMKGRIEPYVVPIVVRAMPLVVQVVRHTSIVPQITSPRERQPREKKHEILQTTSSQERQIREQSQGVKKEHDIRFPKGEEHLHFEGDVCEEWMETTLFKTFSTFTITFVVTTIVDTRKSTSY